MSKAPTRKQHHHGDLRQALIEAGMALLAEGGPEALTLRRCAARAGVSHAAPAHHFDGLAGLRQAIAMEGFRIFRETMEAAAAAGPQTPRARLRGVCAGYLEFAIRHPALFDLMFGFSASELPPPRKDEQNSLAYQTLRQACAPFVGPGQDPAAIESQVWSLVHGFATLYLSGRMRFNAGSAAPRARFDEVMALLDRIGTDPAA
ncbi:TetR/AcrR family transcriptional regulator [Frigidibacter sp. ROC022]|uniref:TetR/AcrR family transcriptional regulator n=1 Tax=Frigidibacter sp. ROC022 TaxID=2971796 RepID=UPI00215A6D7C|nr:TetR/AcrR family transcriptional regulator [Frigidibacter sp. ROC022]MCR8725357.1 TetR/AcrR family transcriptional regulator [Frigidibacter sp. ROC022]